jgi:FkbM family methyltransferase
MREMSPNHHIGRRMLLMRNYGIDLVLDVGANTGQYAQKIRSLGYRAKIVSFEPMKGAYQALQAACASDPAWVCKNIGLGETAKTEQIHVSRNSVSSSILGMLATHSENAPNSSFVDNEQIEIQPLDSLFEIEGWSAAQNIWLKIDVQGYEHLVLAGATKSLEKIAAIQIELSLQPLYDGQLTIVPMMEKLAAFGFEPVAFEPGFTSKSTGEYLQVDGLFRNRRIS